MANYRSFYLPLHIMIKNVAKIFCLIAVVMIVGCQDYGNKHYYHELEKIEHRQNRELARREIMALQKEIVSYPDYIKMYHQLLVAELNEEATPYRNMDVARQLVDYYEQTTDREKLTRSYIIAGHIFANCNDGPKALSYYYKAEELLDEQKDPEMQNRLYSKMAYLFLRHNMPDQARTYATRSQNYCWHNKDTLGMIQALRYISETYKQVPGNELANLEEAYKLAKQSQQYELQKELIIDIASCYCDNERYRMALNYLRPLKNKLPQNDRHRVDALLAKAYYHIGNGDSASIFAQRALEDGNSVSKRDAHEVLAHIAIQQGHRDAANEHFSKYKELNDALNRIQSNETIAQMDAFYHNQKQAEENARLRFDNSHKQNVIVIVIACLLVLIILFGTYFQRHRRKQELMALRILQLEEFKLAYEKTDENERSQTEQSIQQTAIYQRLVTMEESDHPNDEEWQALTDAINQAYPQFTPRLLSLCKLTSHEYHVCLLLKAGFEPIRIANLTLRSKAAVSTVRSRLYEKAFGKKGSAKDWDEVIRTL